MLKIGWLAVEAKPWGWESGWEGSVPEDGGCLKVVLNFTNSGIWFYLF